jgi:hypothetical protein
VTVSAGARLAGWSRERRSGRAMPKASATSARTGVVATGIPLAALGHRNLFDLRGIDPPRGARNGQPTGVYRQISRPS